MKIITTLEGGGWGGERKKDKVKIYLHFFCFA